MELFYLSTLINSMKIFSKKSDQNLVWIDMEMTGLDSKSDSIIEIASIVTDSELNILAEGPNLAIQTPQSKLEAMDEWCTKTHAKSGLTEAVLASEITLQEAEQRTLDFISNYVGSKESPMCGSTVSFDREFMKHQGMTNLEAYFNHKHIDVSSIKELANRWKPSLKAFEGAEAHEALADIRESIAMLKYYRANFIQ